MNKKAQQAIKEALEKEILKHINSNNKFDKVLSTAFLVDPYNEEPDPCSESCRGMCSGCYDGKHSLDWRSTRNIFNEKPFRNLSDHEIDKLISALNNKKHICDDYCSDFICYEHEATGCKTWYCANLFLKDKRNIKYCSAYKSSSN